MSPRRPINTQKTTHSSYLHGVKDSPRDRIEKPTAIQAAKRKVKKSAKNYNVTKYTASILTTLVGAGLLIASDYATSGLFSTALLTTGAVVTASGVGSGIFRRFSDKFITKFRAGKFLQVSNGLQAFLVGLGITLTGLGLTIAPEILPFIPLVFGANYLAGQLNESAYFNKKLEYDKRSKAIDSATKDLISRLNPVQRQTLKSGNIAHKKHSSSKIMAGHTESSFLATSNALSTSAKFFPKISDVVAPLSPAFAGVGIAAGITHDQLMKKGAKANLLRAQGDFAFVHNIANPRRSDAVLAIISDVSLLLSPEGFVDKSHNHNVLFYTRKALLESGLSTKNLLDNKEDIKVEILRILRPLMEDTNNFSRDALRDLGTSLSIDDRRTSILDTMPLLEREISAKVAIVVNRSFYEKAKKISSEIVKDFNLNIEGSEDKKLFGFGLQNIVLKALSKSQGAVDEVALKKLISNELPKYLEENFFDDMTIPSKEKLHDEVEGEDKENATNEALINRAMNKIWDKVEKILPKVEKQEKMNEGRGYQVRNFSPLVQQFKNQHSTVPAA